MKTDSQEMQQLLIKHYSAFDSLEDNQINESIHTIWNPMELKQDGTIDMFLLNWEPVYFINAIKIFKDTHYIVKDDVTYNVYYCPNSDPINIIKAKKVALSFRLWYKFNIATCLVKFIY